MTIPISTDFLVFIGQVMDRLDEQGRHGWYLIFDNAPIHTPKFIQEEIERHGYHMVFLPRYSPFLNPIEEFFSKVFTIHHFIVSGKCCMHSYI